MFSEHKQDIRAHITKGLHSAVFALTYWFLKLAVKQCSYAKHLFHLCIQEVTCHLHPQLHLQLQAQLLLLLPQPAQQEQPLLQPLQAPLEALPLLLLLLHHLEVEGLAQQLLLLLQQVLIHIIHS